MIISSLENIFPSEFSFMCIANKLFRWTGCIISGMVGGIQYYQGVYENI